MYPLNDCKSCLHNQVCKYMEEFKKVQNDSPIDLSSASCDHHTPQVKQSVPEPEQPATESIPIPNSPQLQGLMDLIDGMGDVTMISMCESTYENTFGSYQYPYIMYKNCFIDILIDTRIPPDVFYLYGGEDIDGIL